MQPTIALLTDFGTSDTYVGVMKGVMATICPNAHFIDLTHEILPQNIRAGAFSLLKSYRYFPAGTVFLVVVDPGVGSVRKPIAVRAGGYTFVAPDNGVLSYALADFESYIAHELTDPAYRLRNVSNTFHGRDIFAPAAAHLAAGTPIEPLGARVSDIVQLETPKLEVQDNEIHGQVLHIDHFGNVVTSIGELLWSDADHLSLRPRSGQTPATTITAANAVTSINQQSIRGIRHSYSETFPGELLVLVGSSGHLEIAVNQGNAAKSLNITHDTPVTLTIG